MHGEHGAETVPRNRLFGFIDRLISTGLAALAILTLAACTGDPAPVGTVPNGSPTSSSASPTIAEPVRPIDKATPESAIQFTRYFIDQYNYAYQSYDTTSFEAISGPSCEYCKSVTQDVRSLSDQKASLTGYVVTLVEATTPPVKIKNGTIVVATIMQTPGTRTSSAGTKTNLDGVKNLHATFGLDWTKSGWVVGGVDLDTKTGTPWPG